MIVVIADDLSGAAELAGIARRHGLSAEVQTAFVPKMDADVVCLDTNSRSLSAQLAAARVGAMARDVIAARPAWIFKKCDSVLRGSVLVESRAIAAAAGQARMTIVSANPSHGRIVRDGIYFVQGRPLDETAFARDPEHPRTSSRVMELLAVNGDLAGVAIPDATTIEDMARHAAQLDDDSLPVGAADFFDAILQKKVSRRSKILKRADETYTTDETATENVTLLVCGSAAAWATRRGEAAALGVPVFSLPLDAAGIVEALRIRKRVVVGIGDGAATGGASPSVLAASLAETVGAILRGTVVTRLLSEGGATSAAIVRAMNWTRLRVSEISPHGIGVLRPVGVSDPTPTLFIKPGSYRWPAEIWPGLTR